MSIRLNRTVFEKRLNKISSYWKSASQDGIFKGADALLFPVGQSDSFQRISAFQVWLFGYELPDVVIALCEDTLHILASGKKVDLLKQIQPAAGASSETKVVLHVRSKEDQDKSNFTTICECIRKSKNGKKVGVISKDSFQGSFIQSWTTFSKSQDFEEVDISMAISVIMSVKDQEEIASVKESAELATAVMKTYFINELEQIIDSEKKITHSALAESTEAAILDPEKWKVSATQDNVDSVYTPIVQSGGIYDLKPSASSDDRELHFGTILCSIGCRNKSYCSNISRTILVDPTKTQEKNYKILLEARSAVLKKLKPGTELSSLYESALSVIRKHNSELVSNFTPSIGFGMGLEFREAPLLINAKNKRQVQNGMVFNLSLGFSDLKESNTTDPKSETYSLLVADTVAVLDREARVLTPAPLLFPDISYFFKDPDDKSDDDKENLVVEPLDAKGRAVIESRLRGEERTEKSSDESRREHQAELAERLHQEAQKRILASSTNTSGTVSSKAVRISYQNSAALPSDRDVQNLKIFIDRRNDTVILPIYGYAVPFHISFIKNVNKTEHNEYAYLRINFYAPGVTFAASEPKLPLDDKSAHVREVMYRSLDHASISENFRLIKEQQKKLRAQESERKEREDLVVQRDLIVNRQRNVPRLNELYIRPNFTQKKVLGSLEAHVNGFRYLSNKGDKLDIIYGNIRHAIFQPCEKEMIVLIHFNLKSPILIGKKKFKDIQFFTEVMEASADVGGKRTNIYDREELEQEQRERELRNKLNEAFANFVKKAQDASQQDPDGAVIEFDMPFRDLGFFGVPARSNVLLQPTTNCLVSLVEQPPFVLALEDVELVHFERVDAKLSVRNFDMVFIKKDYTQPVIQISSIPMSSIEGVKEWLDSVDLKYNEGAANLNWTSIMKTINEDTKGFFEDGGWSFLEPDGSSEVEEDDEEEDEFVPSDDSTPSSESYESENSEDASYSDESEGEDEEEGKDWDELEEEARNEDNNKHNEPSEIRSSDKFQHQKHQQRDSIKRPNDGKYGDRDRFKKRH